MKKSALSVVVGLCLTVGLTQAYAVDKKGVVNFTGAIMSDSCTVETDSQTQVVNLENISKGNIANIGDISPAKNFDIKLTGCDEGQSVTLKLTGTAYSGASDVLALSAGGASGVGIAIWETAKSSSDRLGIDKETTAQVANNSGNMTYSFQAAYITQDTITPGVANGTATFEIVYP